MKVLISGTSSWSIWKFRYKFLQYLDNKNYELYFLLNDKIYLKRFKIKKINFIKFNVNFLFSNILSTLNKYEIRTVVEYDIKNLIYHKFTKLFYPYKYNLIVIWAGLGNNYNLKGKFNILERLILKFILSSCAKVVMINQYDLSVVKNYRLHNKLELIKTEGYVIKNKKFDRKFSIKRNYNFVSAFRPIKSKGVIEIINAAKEFQEHNFYLYVIKNSKKLKYNTKNINLDKLRKIKNVHIVKQVDDLNLILGKYDCIISASYGEGFGLTIAEAADNLIPIISTENNGCKSIFRDKILIFIKTKNIKSLCNGINKFIKMNNGQKSAMTHEAKKDLLKINNNKIHNKLLRLINETS